jgi:hypothetical protein
MKTFLNILPPEKKNDLRLAKRYRLLIRQESSFFFLSFFLLGLLSGIWFLLSLEEKSILTRSQNDENLRKAYADIALYEEDFSRVQSMVSPAEKALKEQKKVVWIFRFLEENISEGIKVVAVSAEGNLLKISGNADNRDHLLSFEEGIKGEKCFSDISIPLTQLAKKEDIDFEITVSVEEKCFISR